MPDAANCTNAAFARGRTCLLRRDAHLRFATSPSVASDSSATACCDHIAICALRPVLALAAAATTAA
eukprot:11407332-Alexandrium_andersonii.AAC.1